MGVYLTCWQVCIIKGLFPFYLRCLHTDVHSKAAFQPFRLLTHAQFSVSTIISFYQHLGMKKFLNQTSQLRITQ